jgi:hypothetical protein
MKMKVTRFSHHDSRLYSVEIEGGTRPGIKAHELKHWLLDLGVSDSIISVVLDIAPSESITIDIPDSQRSQYRKAS